MSQDVKKKTHTTHYFKYSNIQRTVGQVYDRDGPERRGVDFCQCRLNIKYGGFKTSRLNAKICFSMSQPPPPVFL